MKLSIVHMVIGLVLVIGLSVYLGQARPILPAEPFQLAQPVTTHGIVPTVPLVAEEAFVEEPFVGASSSSPIVSVSDTAYNAMSLKQKSDLIRQVQNMVRTELLAARQLHNLKEELHEEEEEYEEEREHHHRPSEDQGRDFYRRSEKSSETCNGGEDEYRCPKNPDGSCPPVPDMTQYIRKDQIPCWGCSIDY